ncbi:MAG: hypothetical protein K6D59_09620 [Bacteroidales bacterium]|nr:hypothetical protein [Bacteroidales bacterium]
MKSTHNTILFVACLAFSAIHPISLMAQSDTTKSQYSESVIVVGDYNPVLDGVGEKVNEAPAVNENADAELQPSFSYSITPIRISTLTATSGLKAAKVVASPTKLYNNYLRFGLGHDFASFVDFNPLVDLYYTSTRHDNYSYGARLYHQTDITTFGKKDDLLLLPDYYGRDRHTNTSLDLFGKYILNKKHLFSANLLFDREYGRYYGFSDSMLFATKTLTRDDISFSDYAFAYNNVALGFGAQSLNTDVNKLGYDASLSMADFWSRYDNSQLSLDFDGAIHYGFPMFSKYKAVAYLRTHWQAFKQKSDAVEEFSSLPLGYDTLLPLPDQFSLGRHLFSLNPYVDFLFNGFKFHAGLILGFNAYDDTAATTHNLLPDIAVTKTFSNNAISLTAGFKGDYNANDWNSIRLQNPYVAPAPNSLATVDNNLYAHLRFNFSKKLQLNVTVDNHFLDNKMFFQLDPRYSLGNVFQPYYVNLSILELGTEFSFVNDEMLRLSLGCEYNVDYNVPDNIPLLYDNHFTAFLNADVNYKDKWIFSLQTLFLSSCDADYVINPVTNLPTITNTLPARFGVSFETEYMYSRALSFFAKLDNLTFQRYFLWANYPAQRFNAMLGLTYTIPTRK